MPGWRYDAAATLDLGGTWVTVGDPPGRDPTSADLTVALNGTVVDSAQVAQSHRPGNEGVYNLVFTTEYWMGAATGNPTVSFPTGTFVSPTHGPLGAFSAAVTLVDCTPPRIARATLLDTGGYKCATEAVTCPPDGLWRAAFVLELVFLEPVFRANGSPVTDAELEVYTAGGVATVMGTYAVQSVGGARGRRLAEAVGTTLDVAIELSSGAMGAEAVRVRAREAAIRDGSGLWFLPHGDANAVAAEGNVLMPFDSQAAATGRGPVSAVIAVGPVGVVCLVLLMVAGALYHGRRKRAKVKAAPRSWGTWAPPRRGHKGPMVAPKLQLRRLRSKAAAAPADALAIVTQHDFLRGNGVRVELTARWIDTLADTVVDALRGAQPACALPPGVLMTARVVHSNLQGGLAPGDLGALWALAKLLRDGSSPHPERLAARVDLLQQTEWYAYALTAVRGHVPACRAAFATAGLKQPMVRTDADAVALVLGVVEMHARLGERQREAQLRVHLAVEAPYTAWLRSRRRSGGGGGFTDLGAAVPSELSQACRKIHATVVARKLAAAGLVASPEPLAAPGVAAQGLSARREAYGQGAIVQGFQLRISDREEEPMEMHNVQAQAIRTDSRRAVELSEPMSE